MKLAYKTYFYDIGLNDTYPITVYHENICSYTKWLNGYVRRWNMEVLYCEIIDDNLNNVGNVDFLPTELERQQFITTYRDRLTAYYEYLCEGGDSY